MLRARLGEALKSAMKAKDARRVATLRLILAALKDRDIAARGEGNAEGIADEDILTMLATMIRQRRDSIAFYKKGGRDDLVRQEQEETEVIQDFLPKQLDEQEVESASREMIAEVGAKGLKDMGRIMAGLKARYAGRMDFGKASGIVKEILT